MIFECHQNQPLSNAVKIQNLCTNVMWEKLFGKSMTFWKLLPRIFFDPLNNFPLSSHFQFTERLFFLHRLNRFLSPLDFVTVKTNENLNDKLTKNVKTEQSNCDEKICDSYVSLTIKTTAKHVLRERIKWRNLNPNKFQISTFKFSKFFHWSFLCVVVIWI